MAGASLMFFAFLGFESISMAADETKEPQKKIPQGIFFSIGLTTLLYVLVTLVLTGTVHYTKLNTADVVPFVLRSIGFPLVGNIVSVVVILTLVTVCISMMFALSRVIYNVSCDGLLPEQFLRGLSFGNPSFIGKYCDFGLSYFACFWCYQTS